MIGCKRFLTSFPSWTFSILWTVVMIWINLTPNPLIDSNLSARHPFDKVGHFLVAGILAVVIMFDYQRRNRWKPLSPLNILICAGVAMCVSTTMELMQISTFFMRVYEGWDLVSQISGVLIFSLLYFVCQPLWVTHRS